MAAGDTPATMPDGGAARLTWPGCYGEQSAKGGAPGRSEAHRERVELDAVAGDGRERRRAVEACGSGSSRLAQ
jgi:hypothetical protein